MYVLYRNVRLILREQKKKIQFEISWWNSQIFLGKFLSVNMGSSAEIATIKWYALFSSTE